MANNINMRAGLNSYNAWEIMNMNNIVSGINKFTLFNIMAEGQLFIHIIH